MTPKEKAKELLDKYWIYLRANLLYDEEAKDDAKHCALIAVDQILNLNFYINCDATEHCVNPVMDYWNEVKTEIEKL
jgi:hypothetical protein